MTVGSIVYLHDRNLKLKKMLLITKVSVTTPTGEPGKVGRI